MLPQADRHAVTVVEPSEEVRLANCELVRAIVDAGIRNDVMTMLHPYLNDIVLTAQSCAIDPYPALRVRGYALVSLLCNTSPDIVKHYAPGLVKQVMLGLDHRHSKVRLAALDCMDACVTCKDKAKVRGAGTESIVNLIGYTVGGCCAVGCVIVADNAGCM